MKAPNSIFSMFLKSTSVALKIFFVVFHKSFCNSDIYKSKNNIMLVT